MIGEIGSRNDFAKLFSNEVTIGAELGVAKGLFSKRLIQTHVFEHFYCIDSWSSDNHTTVEYLNACKRLLKFRGVSIIRDTFQRAALQFPDNHFDFIYIDGFAHTGQENGETLITWYPKLRNGGIFAGHDYHRRWQQTIEVVNRFTQQHRKQIALTRQDKYPSWYFIK